MWPLGYTIILICITVQIKALNLQGAPAAVKKLKIGARDLSKLQKIITTLNLQGALVLECSEEIETRSYRFK